MNDHRKQIIINEINFWKQNRMLPEQYCDFLLALYTEGNGTGKKSRWINGRKRNLIWLTLIPIITFFIYFTELSLILQITFSVFFLTCGFGVLIYCVKKSLPFQIPLIITAINFLFISVEFTEKIFSESMISLYLILILNCLIWLAVGMKFKFLYFTISGILGILFLMIFLFFPF